MTIRQLSKSLNNLLFDGNENDFYEKELIIPVSTFVNISTKVIGAKYFSELKKELPENAVEQILKIHNEIRLSEVFPNTYVSGNNFPQRYKIVENDSTKTLVLFSFGEFQPGRYKIFLEGIWEIREN